MELWLWLLVLTASTEVVIELLEDWAATGDKNEPLMRFAQARVVEAEDVVTPALGVTA